MKILFRAILVTLLPLSLFASDKPVDLKCVFDKTLSVGASISGNTMINPGRWKWATSIDLYWLGVHETQPFFFGYGPAEYLSVKYAQTPVNDYLVSYINMKTDLFNDENGLNYFGDPDIDIDLKTGGDVIYALQTGQYPRRNGYPNGESAPEVKSKFYESSSIVGVDMFYFAAAFGDCWKYSGSQSGFSGMIRDFIDLAYTNKKPLVLGTVPEEVEKNITYKNIPLVRDQLYVPTKRERSCIEEINHAILKHCKPEKECYTVRLDVIVKQLNINDGFIMQPLEGEKTDNPDGLVKRTHGQIRPLGLNVTHEGSRIMYESIERQMQQHPPRCAQ